MHTETETLAISLDDLTRHKIPETEEQDENNSK